MLDFYKKYWRTAFDIAVIVLTVYLIMWLFSLFYDLAAPILLALIIFMIIEPLARFLHKRGMKKIFATSISVIVYSIILLALLAGLGYMFVTQTLGLVERFPRYMANFQFEIVAMLEYAQEEWNALPENVTLQISEYAAQVGQFITTSVQSILGSIAGAISSFSNFVISFGLGIILAFFLSLEADKWRRIANDKTPHTFKQIFIFLRDNVVKGITSYLKALLKLISISFVTILIGLLILGVDNAIAISLFAAALDILPLLGVSALFIPWIVYLLIVGNTWLAIWLTVLLIIVLVTRQILEPRIMGNSLGVSAFTMLAFMILSTSIFGIAGLILSPVLTVLIKALYDQGYLKRWIRVPEEEFESRSESELQKSD